MNDGQHETSSSFNEVLSLLTSRGVGARVTGSDTLSFARRMHAQPATVRLVLGTWTVTLPAYSTDPGRVLKVGRADAPPSRIVEELFRMAPPVLTPGRRAAQGVPAVAGQGFGTRKEMTQLADALAAVGIEAEVLIEAPNAFLALRGVTGWLVVQSGSPGIVADEVVGSERTRYTLGPPGTMTKELAGRVRVLLGRHTSTFNSDRAQTWLEGFASVLRRRGVPVDRLPSGLLEIEGTQSAVGATVRVRGGAVLADRDGTTEVLGDAQLQSPEEVVDETLLRLVRTHQERAALNEECVLQLWDLSSDLAPAITVIGLCLEKASERGLSDVVSLAVEALDLARATAERADDHWARRTATIADVVSATEAGSRALGQAMAIGEMLAEAARAERPDGAASVRADPPVPRLIADWSAAEQVAAEWIDWFGLGPAAVTQATRDGGVDVSTPTAVAQVKDFGKAISAGPVRELYAVAHVEGKAALFFARAGFTSDALAWGERAGVAMFTFDLQGTPEPMTTAASVLMDPR